MSSQYERGLELARQRRLPFMRKLPIYSKTTYAPYLECGKSPVIFAECEDCGLSQPASEFRHTDPYLCGDCWCIRVYGEQCNIGG